MALERMSVASPKPKKPMGEAWFIAPEREMYPLLLGDLDALADEQFERPITEMAIGPTSFGELPEWTEWYHYLLPRLLQRTWRPILHHPVELLFTGFISQHPDSSGVMPYRDFCADALATLGQYIMSPPFWVEPEAAPQCFTKWCGPSGICGWYKTDGLMSASLFFCLKYLDADRVGPWFRSVAAIPNRYWQAQLLTWLVGAHPILTDEISQPATLPGEGLFGVGWEWSHVLSGNYSGDHAPPIQMVPFLSPENRDALLGVARELNTDEFFEDFLTDPQMEAVAAETSDLRDRFLGLYR